MNPVSTITPPSLTVSGATSMSLTCPFPREMPSRTKLVATLGPASESDEMLAKLILAGVSVFRFNFSHGSLEEHAERLERVRAVAKQLQANVAVMGDLQGPKIRVGKVPPPGITLRTGQDVSIRRAVPEAFVADDGTAVFGTTYEQMIHEVRAGQRVLVNDGAIRMLAIEDAEAMARGELRCRVTVGGLVTSSKGINLPESDVRAPSLTERDEVCVRFAAEHGFDYLAISFVRTADDVRVLKRLLEDCGKGKGEDRIPVIAKIEKPQAVANIDEIAKTAHALMVARGDLGVEMDIAHTPIAQRLILEAAKRYGKPAIVATQMLESMIKSVMPTRAEASDVATAIFAGASAVMLSGETAVGRHPALVVETMRRIALEAEAFTIERDSVEPSLPAALDAPSRRQAALAHGAWHLARDLGVKAVACWSQTGGMARNLSRSSMAAPVLAYSSDFRWTRRMALLSNITPILAEPPSTGYLADWTDQVEADLMDFGWVDPGDHVLLIAGKPLGAPQTTSAIAVLEVGNRATGFRAHDR
ncbi:MAG: pyruvate kinase [Phycisphaerales bacterium]|nr:MAG: pyruvate kinase [Phycisphaerales bacterium]